MAFLVLSYFCNKCYGSEKGCSNEFFDVWFPSGGGE